MVCIAAFIILCLIGVVVAFISIFKKEVGKRYWVVFKKAWHCVFKKVRLQKCDTDFKDDVKNLILRKVILKRPKLVKPISALIEIFSIIIVFVTVWSLVIAIKSLLALWVFGTCNVSKPSECSLTSESCSIDQAEATNIFEQLGQNLGQWGEIIGGIPDRLRTWGVEDFSELENLPTINPNSDYDLNNVAFDIMDPGCIVCLNSYNNQLKTDFAKSHKIKLVVYPIKNPNEKYRFKNSEIASKYLIAAQMVKENFAAKIINRLFTGSDDKNVSFQTRLNNDWDEKETIKTFSSWLKESGASEAEIRDVEQKIQSSEVENELKKNKKVVDEKIHAKSIPTMVYDGKKHSGLYKN